MPLHVKSSDVKEIKGINRAKPEPDRMVVRKGYGNECSLMIATRKPGYHTKPHQHESEQINYVLDGEIWFFVKDKGFHCKKGDFHRIPANTIHWACNRSDADARWPKPMPRDSSASRPADPVALYDDGETPKVRGPGSTSSSPTTRKGGGKYFGK